MFDWKKRDGNSAEVRVYMAHKDIENGTKLYYVGEGVESTTVATAVESTEKNTIAQRLGTVENKAGGLSFQIKYPFTPEAPMYDAFVAMDRLQKVNEQFDLVIVEGHFGVEIEGVVDADKPLARKCKAKVSMTGEDLAGKEKVSFTVDIKSDGDITVGVMDFGTDEAPNYVDDDTISMAYWKPEAFTALPADTTIAQIKSLK